MPGMRLRRLCANDLRSGRPEGQEALKGRPKGV